MPEFINPLAHNKIRVYYSLEPSFVVTRWIVNGKLPENCNIEGETGIYGCFIDLDITEAWQRMTIDALGWTAVMMDDFMDKRAILDLKRQCGDRISFDCERYDHLLTTGEAWEEIISLWLRWYTMPSEKRGDRWKGFNSEPHVREYLASV